MSGKREKAKRKAAAAPARPVAQYENASGLVLPDGSPAVSSIQATEASDVTPADLQFFRSLVRRMWPLKSPSEQEAQARAMYARHPFIEKAYRDGLRMGRDLRERTQRGLGWEPWESLKALLPQEITFVLSKIRAEIGVEQ